MHKNCFLDRFFYAVKSDREAQGLLVKLPFMDAFTPVLNVSELPEDPEFLKIEIGSASYPGYPPMPDRSGWDPRDECVQVYFVHKTQAIFRMCERR